jgi:signal transduction histidine kinase
MARTILQLGEELISSDAVAFYELIKNSFDAKSRRVDIDVICRIPHELYVQHRDIIAAEIRLTVGKKVDASSLRSWKDAVLADIDQSAPRVKDLKAAVDAAADWQELAGHVDAANCIEIVDTGTGMSADDLDDVYLTVGTRNRRKQREEAEANGIAASRPILGEKGLGRLSTMRLGQCLRVETTVSGEPMWNVLEIDWGRFSHDSDELIEDVEVKPTSGASKADVAKHGTRILITGLASGWSEERLKEIAANEFSKLQDPFQPRSDYRISLRFNDTPVTIPAMDTLLFEHAHAVVEAEFTVSGGEPRLAGRVDYKQHKRQKTFELAGAQLLSITGSLKPTALLSLGPFKVILYWFNRQLLTAVEGIGDRRAVQRLQSRWAGGLMVFRDGFRVHPYGNPDDDWIDLDRKALASAGYKVNRRQIIGKVTISSAANPRLVDQTNREGLRDCAEKHVLIELLRHVLETQFRAFLNAVDKEVRARIPVSFDDLEERVGVEEQLIRRSMQELMQKHPEIKQDTRLIAMVEESTQRLREVMTQAKELAAGYDKGHNEMVYLAGLGLMVEILAHELNRSTHHTLVTLAAAERSKLPKDVAGTFATLESQLKTLQKRLRILDPLSTPGRQRKEEFELVSWVEEILRSHEAQFKRHRIVLELETRPVKGAELRVKMVKGMMVQILENLLSNSVYWLKQERKLRPAMSLRISVAVDTKARTVSVTDNGPGVSPEDKEYIFQPFVTTKPPGEGKGLGLYISREIANYHGATLHLSDEETARPGRLNTFVLSLGENPK